MRKLTVLDLYAGTGRCSQPFQNWKRIKQIYLADVNQYAQKVYQLNYPKASYKVCNLSNTSSKALADFAGGKVDILLGCPPCQGFSDCGSRLVDDPRNSHVSRLTRIVTELNPLAIAMENVPLAASSDKFKLLTQTLEALGYKWSCTIANAALWGSCQTRQRLILIAIRKDVNSAPAFAEPTHGGSKKYFSYREGVRRKIEDDPISILGTAPASFRISKNLSKSGKIKCGSLAIPTVGEVLENLPRIGTPRAKELGHQPWKHGKEILRRMGRVKEGGRWRGGKDHFSQTYGRLHRHGLARTITGFFPNAGSGRFWHPTENRSLTLREAARIQGFPDSFRFLNADGSNCILVGNALDKTLADMTYRIVRSLLE